MQETQSNHHYRTSDIVLASFLFSQGVQLIELDRSNPHRIVFVFQEPPSSLLSQWQEGTATANVLALFNAHATLKEKLFGSVL